jgi:hypothetical protein
MTEYFGTGTKKGRGMALQSLDLIEAMRVIAETTQPITGRGVGYKLFTQGRIASMAEMRSVYRLLLIAREQGIIPWDWIVDETRSLERVATWDDPEQYARIVARSYRRDFWNQQPHRGHRAWCTPPGARSLCCRFQSGAWIQQRHVNPRCCRG